MSVFEGFLSTPEMQEVFSETSIVQAMMDFEAALARALAAEGVIPAAAATAIAGVCKAELYDVPAIVAASGRAGSLAIPLVRKLTETVGLFDASAAAWVHWGSTSQDVIDTALVLATRRGLTLVDRDLQRLVVALQRLVRVHARTPALARTLMQPAQVVSFGYKALSWLAPLARRRTRLREAARAALRLQFGGAVGTLGTLEDQGPAVLARVAEDLGLGQAPLTWHTQRDEWIALGTELGVLCGSLGKIARDLALLSQAEVAEVAEPSGSGRGGSSAMPHKRNPVAAMVALAAALRVPQRVAALLAAMPQEQERGLGNWQAELAEWSGLFLSVHGALAALAEAIEGLDVDEARMRANIDALLGLPFTEAVKIRMARDIGIGAAHEVLERLSREAIASRQPLSVLTRAALADDPRLAGRISAAEIERLFDPDHAAAQAARIVERQLPVIEAAMAAESAQGPLVALVDRSADAQSAARWPAL